MNSDFTVELKTNDLKVHSIDHEEDWQVTLAYTGELTMTGARVSRAAAKYLGDARQFAVTYGDGVTDADLAEEYRFHLEEGRLGTVLGVNPPSRFGELKVEATKVEEFSEKPEFVDNWINGGYFFFHRDFLPYLSSEESCVLEREPSDPPGARRPAQHVQASRLLGLHGHAARPRTLEQALGLRPGPLGRLTRDVFPPIHNPRRDSTPHESFRHGPHGYIGTHLGRPAQGRKATPSSAVTSTSSRDATGSPWSRPIGNSSRTSAKIEAADLDGCDCVMHLAAISNDPMGALNAQLTFDVNRDASIRLAELARRAGVPRYLFAGSCSVYGQGEKLDLDEGDPLNPLTAYAQSKIETEEAVSALADDSFTPVFLRNSTAYGHSPMLRIDLVVNNLLGSAMAYGEIRIQSDGSPWRPLIHCRDIARAFIALAKAPKAAVHNKAINIGANTENYQVRDVGNQVQRLIPSAKITYTGEVGADPRNYRVKFDLLYRLLPDFKLQYNLATGHGRAAPQDGRAWLRQRTTSRATSSSASARSRDRFNQLG